jgi:hypothetical protein
MAYGNSSGGSQKIIFGKPLKDQVGAKSYKRIQLSDTVTIPEYCYKDLLTMLQERVRNARQFTGPMVDRFTEIDKDLSGHIVPNKDDRQRIKDNMLGKGPKMVDENVQFALMQIDEAVTYMLGVIASTPGLYQAITIADKQAIANAFASVMNDHSRLFKHYRSMGKSFLDMFKFNFGGFIVEWFEEKGPKIVGNTPEGYADIDLDSYIRVGNRLNPFDPYNTLLDPAVNPIDLPTDGEFFATVDTLRPFLLKKMAAAGEIFQLDRLEGIGNRTYRYYRMKPTIQHYHVQTGGGRVDWDSYWTGAYGGQTTYDVEAVERCIIYSWIVPSDYKLSTSSKPQIWRFHLLDDQHIIRADQMNNVHNRLPVCIGMPNEDGLKLQSRTFGEMLMPFQRIANAQLNMHQKAMRKRLYGLTIYNRRVIPLLENENLEGGKVPANPTGTGEVNLNNQIVQINDAPDTSRTMEDVTSILGFMKQMLPSTSSQQVADLDRATRYQAAALIQSSNRRNQKLAKLIDDQCLDEGRRMMLLNIMQFQPKVEVLDEASGQLITVDPQQFREIKIEFAIADGMRGLDKLLITDSLREVINMLLQSPEAAKIDIIGLINYYMEMQGDKLDFSQFKYKSPIDALDPQTKQLALQLLVQFLPKIAEQNPDLAKQIQTELQGATGSPPALQSPVAAPGQTAMGTTNGQGA